jgi:formylmethanofuran dehydrogenase subunit C
MINLFPLKDFRYPIVAECISLDVFRGKKHGEIERLEAWEGNRRKKLGELFKIEEPANKGQEDMITLYGDMSKVKRIGA